jgi:DNA-binding NarL/FixJ family response regulator
MELPQLIRLMMVGDDRAFAVRLLGALREAEPGSMALVGAVTGADEACAQAARARADVILVDIETCGMQGIGRIGAACAAPVLALAGQCGAAERVQAVRAGARGVVLKQDPPETIRKALRKVKEGELWLDRLTTSQILRELIPALRAIEPPAAGRIANLTTRESDIVRALVTHDGASGRALAARLRMSEQTLRNHFSSIYRKLGVPNRVGLVAYATRNRLDGLG